MSNASHQRQNGRVASVLADCMRLLGTLGSYNGSLTRFSST